MPELRRILFVFVLLALPASSQNWDTSGNELLNGGYLFRQVAYQTNELGSVTTAFSLNGFISFDGNGNYAINGSLFDSRIGQLAPFSKLGTYSISSSGYGFLQQPLGSNTVLYGLVSNGVFMGSTVESSVNHFNDFMMAVPSGTGSTFNFNGTYALAYFNDSPGSFTTAYTATAQLTPNGFGSIGTVTVTSYRGTDPTPLQVIAQGVTYSFSGGVGSMNFPISPVIGGPKTIFMAPGGNFIFGGSATGFDFFVGVRQATEGFIPPTLSGLYYQGGIDQDNSTVGLGVLKTSYGSFKALPNGVILSHQRYRASSESAAQNRGFQDSYPVVPANQYLNASINREYMVSADGAFRIGMGRAPLLGIEVGVRKPLLSGQGVFLDPTGVVNAASYSMFTSGVARGELLILYGTNLADALAVAPGANFPVVLGGVQVLMNDRPAALYYVSPGQIAVVVPYATTEPIVQIKVIKNGTASNTVTTFVYASAPGIFSMTANGIGQGAISHADYSLVTANNPAHPGEIVQIFLTGLGDVTPTIADGAPGGINPLNLAVNQIRASVDGIPAEIQYAGLAPTLSGMYQLNIKVPLNAETGNLKLAVGGPDAISSQILLPVAP